MPSTRASVIASTSKGRLAAERRGRTSGASSQLASVVATAKGRSAQLAAERPDRTVTAALEAPYQIVVGDLETTAAYEVTSDPAAS